ncbi:MAG: hypothetical protein Q9217_001451 [Psora testacea]
MEEKEIRARSRRAIELMRASWYPPSNPSLSQRQAVSRRYRPAKGPLWACQTSLQIVHDQEVRQKFLQAVRDIGHEKFTFNLQETESVAVEWNGYRRSKGIPSARLSSKETYENLLGDTTTDLTILFIHGGGFVLGSPSTNRVIPSSLAELTKGRVCQVDYRLAPQNPFPAAIYDIFLAYLFLIAPPANAFHQPIPASSIVLAGESSGGNLCLALLQLLLHFKRSGITSLPLNDTLVPLQLPAAITILSSYVDQTESLPSWHTTQHVDYSGQPAFYTAPDFPRDAIWPATPPRYSAYCEGTALCHPLISPTAVKDWRGAPRMWIACGEESVRDANMVIARQAATQGVSVWWEEYVGMPHIFPLLPGLEGTPQARRCLEGWAQFVEACKGYYEVRRAGWGVRIGYDGNTMDECKVENFLLDLELDEVQRRMREGMIGHEDMMRRRQQCRAKL